MNSDEFFSDVVVKWMCKDIEREIERANDNLDAGNVLCALALMAYTEVVGRYVLSLRGSPPNSTECFNFCFKKLGPEYEDFLRKELDNNVKVYDSFRNGLAHEYFTKVPCTIEMLNTPNTSFEVAGESPASVERPVRCGIGRAENESYYIVVEKYIEDFKRACKEFRSECSGSQAISDIKPSIRSNPSSSGA